MNIIDSVIPIVHISTGVASECQQERTQMQNRELTMKKLCAKVYSMWLEEETTKRYDVRKIQVGTKGRSEKNENISFP